jgi:hypothetical protein
METSLVLAMSRNTLSGAARDPGRDGQETICFQNIGPKEQRKRLVFGVVTFVAGLAVATLLIALGANHWWRLALFVPFAAGGIGVFQAREKT